MNKDSIILIAEDDDGHFSLIQRNLVRAGVVNPIQRLRDGQELQDFLYHLKQDHERMLKSYLLFLDIRMPKIDGLELLKHIKEDQEIKKIPVIILTTASDRRDIETCHQLGCCMYLVKPVEYGRFVDLIQCVGAFLSILELPRMHLVNCKTGESHGYQSHDLDR